MGGTVTDRAWQEEPSPPWQGPAAEDLATVDLTGDRYRSRSYFEQEWEHLWTRVWLLLGRANQIPDPGDYQVEEVGAESFIIMRQADGSIRTFYNTCQHRGSRLLFSTGGRAQRLTCPYHSWTYDLDGTLVWVRDAEDFPGGDPCQSLRLAEVRTEQFCGWVWITMDDDAVSLREFLGPIWDEWVAYQPDDWQRVTALTARVPCNWKVVQDNFCESYHLPTVHPQMKDTHEENYRYTDFQMAHEGHNRMVMRGATPSVTQYGDNPPLPASLRERLAHWGLDPADFVARPLDARAALQQQMRTLGPQRGHHHYDQLRDQQFTDSHHYNLFPNCSVTFAADGVLLQRMRPHATDPEQCLVDHWYYAFVPAEAEPVIAATNIRIDGIGVQHQVFDYGDTSMGLVPDQDLSITVGQQLGMRSRGFRRAFLAGQEARIAHFHHVIDDYLAGRR